MWITGKQVIIFALAVSFLNCSGKKIDENDPASLMNEVEENIRNDHYQLAIDKLRVIKNKFPYSKQSIEAQLRIADVYFLQESFSEAAMSYETFRDLHPKHEKVAYAMFRIGKSHYMDIPSHVSRDLTPASRAFDAYQEYLRRFPQDKNTEEARKNVSEIRKLLAEKELYIGNFYFKRDEYVAAKNRYQKILDLYPDTSVAEEAQKKLNKIGEKQK
ncbi:MAG: outer membrane protein assembly factor BamD [Bdellovibrio sp.]|nr:outer membrane protein assembly factor BamD [Bdellovibrio sp.]